MKVIGVAGHVDHGKSSLVLALTGIDPDRLAEEKARQMTIDLGFAWLTLPDGETVGVVDVPGHIDFIKNMLAGIGGIDAALLVIAADEGVMPQTREHLAILDLLNVTHGLVALNKVDLVDDPDWLTLVQADVVEVLAGTSLAAAPVVPVSATTGAGLETLLAELGRVLQAAPPRRAGGRPRLPVDRVFTMPGFGVIVTGTLSDGALAVGQEVEIALRGLRARVRGLQTHKQKLEQAEPGSRVAVNLSGAAKGDLARGDVLALPGALTPTTLLDVRLRVAPGRSLRHNQAIDFFSGAAEVTGRVRLLDADSLDAGQEGWVQVRLDAPAAVQAGDRFIVRQASPSRTLGGGAVISAHPNRRWRRFRPEVLARLERQQRGDAAELLLDAVQRAEPVSYQTALAASSLEPAAASAALERLLQEGQLLVLDRAGAATADATQSLISTAGWHALRARIEGILVGHHRQFPLRLGMSREELKSRLAGKRRPLAARPFNDLLAQAVAEGWLADEGATVRLSGHNAALTPAQQAAVTAAGPRLAPACTVADAVAAVGEDVLQWLVERGMMIRAGDDVLFEAAAYEVMTRQVVAHLQTHEALTVAEARDQLAVSRKIALALLEHLDVRRITRRVGDTRVLRKAAD